MKYWLKQAYTTLTYLNKNNIIVFSEYNKQLTNVIRRASSKNRIYFLLEKGNVFNYKNIDNIEGFSLIVNWYRGYFKDIGCNYFVINTMPRNDLDRHAALVAASEVDSVKVVYLDHGDTGFSDPSGVWHWFNYADYFYASNTESRKYINKQIVPEGFIVREWKRPLPKRKKSKKYVLFAPGFYNGELFIGQLTDTAKYRHTETIIRYLNECAIDFGYGIIYKTIKGSHEAFNPRSVDKFVEYEAVEYMDSGNFNKLLSKASAFVTDCVSTPFYDAVDMGIPSLCLYNSDGTPLRKTVLDMFGDAIKVCNQDAIIGYTINNFFTGKFSLGYKAMIEHNIDPMPWEG